MLKQNSASAGRWILFLLTFINLFNYLDRYILVALSPAIKHELSLSDTEVGFLASAFMLTYFLISPLFGWMGDRKPRLKLMGMGVAVWSLATALSGLGRTAGQLIASRLFVGVGEAAYGSISPSVLKDLFPKEKVGRVFAIFFMAIPVGSALGFLLGGFLEEWVGWRHAFFVAGLPGLLLAIGLMLQKEPERGAFDEGVEKEEVPSAREAIRALKGNSSYMLTVLGYCAYTFVVGGTAVWIPHYFERYLGVAASEGNKVFGMTTVVAGFLATLIGGAWADRWAKRSSDAYLKLSALSMFLALPVYMAALGTNSFTVFCVCLFFLDFFLFLSTSPINAEIVNCVGPTLRATANAASIFAIHLLGDAISPAMIGFVSDHSNLRLGMQLFSVAILISALIWAWKVLASWEVMPWPAGGMVLPKAQCHRGLHLQGVQENTLEAFRGAAKAGAEMVELDVRLSRDGQAVVIHDADISRVAGGRAGNVAELTAAELKSRASAPSLYEVLADRDCARLLVNVELKHLGDAHQNRRLAAAVQKALSDAKAESRVIFSSFNPLLLREMSKLLPDVPRALLATGAQEPGNKFYLRKMWLAFLARPHMLNLDGRSFSAKLAASLAARRVPVAVWTVETPEEARKFLAMGAKSIISPIPKVV